MGFNLKMSDFFCFQGYCIDIVINSKHVVFGSVEILEDIMFLVSAEALKVKYKTFTATKYKSSSQKGRVSSFSVHILHRKLLFAFYDAENIIFTLCNQDSKSMHIYRYSYKMSADCCGGILFILQYVRQILYCLLILLWLNDDTEEEFHLSYFTVGELKCMYWKSIMLVSHYASFVAHQPFPCTNNVWYTDTVS